MELFILLGGSFLAAMISGAAGFGGSLLLLPVASACVGARTAVPVLTIAQLMGNIARMSAGWSQIRWREAGLFSLTALPLAALGALGFNLLPPEAVSRFVGAALILLVMLKLALKKELPRGRGTLLVGGALTGGLSGLCGSGGPIGAAVFLSLDLPPVAYIASEAATATAMHILKIFVYSKLSALDGRALLIGLAMGGCMVLGTYAARRFIRGMDKGRFQRYVAVLLCAVGVYMVLTGGG